MYCVMTRIFIFVVALTFVSATNIFDILWSQDEYMPEKRGDRSDAPPSNCNCDGPRCMCCVDFNLTYIDLGGPGCVGLRFLSQQDGIAVNVSYGESLLHSEEVKGPNPPPTCMSLLANLAQVCARFSNLNPYNNGLRGCLLLEPKLLGEVTTSFNIGCFTMGPEGMKMEENLNTTFNSITENLTNNQTTSESEELNEEELIAAVNESAEQGLTFFGSLLGLAFGKPKINETNIEHVTTEPNSTS